MLYIQLCRISQIQKNSHYHSSTKFYRYQYFAIFPLSSNKFYVKWNFLFWGSPVYGKNYSKNIILSSKLHTIYLSGKGRAKLFCNTCQCQIRFFQYEYLVIEDASSHVIIALIIRHYPPTTPVVTFWFHKTTFYVFHILQKSK